MEGAVQPLADKIMRVDDMKTLKQTTWALANLCRGKTVNFRVVQVAAPAFIKVIISKDDLELLTDALMGLSDVCNEQ